MAVETSQSSDLTVTRNESKEANENPSQEFQDLIATLPTKLDKFGIELCQYQGFWFAKTRIKGILKCHKQFQARDSDIFLATSPKSGTTWIKALIFVITNRNTHNPTSTIINNNPHAFVPFLEHLLQDENTSNSSSFLSSSLPRILATHIPYVLLPEALKQSRLKMVYLGRNPKDLFVSYWHFMSKVKPESQGCRSLEDSFEEFCQGVSFYGPFWDQMLGYYKESLERPWKILFLTFEELKNDPVRTVKQLAEFIGYGFSQEEENGDVVDNILKLCSFENLSCLEVNRTESSPFGFENKLFFRCGEVGDWKNLLTVDMAKRIDSIIQEKLEKHGLKF
ncbi:hypothetical protein QN277_029024 [Acacia crassicarpa]|uniref:Sulfotransferase n=1 Tax=Acacia crassicarpa TaxID=499986 RepID=A0AAE1MKF2_9FABA|nr:hypothetical protein QN277_029024 [Acacia crassicarpa]